MRLTGMIYGKFQATSDPQRKEVLLNELKSIPRIHIKDDLKDSHVGMLLGNMLRVMGPAREYHRYMEEAFATCITGLEDGVSYNDGPSLRLLAKILSSLNGLERDAQIAYSAQYSALDRSIEDSERSRDHLYDRRLADDKPTGQSELVDELLKNGGAGSDMGAVRLDVKIESEGQNNVPGPTLSSSMSATSPQEPAISDDGKVAAARDTAPDEPGYGRPRHDFPEWTSEEDQSGYSHFCDGCQRVRKLGITLCISA
ncbi:hypothetical protein K458DRAFT_418980 [Lentithecium fluviatile CBS 122367]|uniref:Uncharacterized protein n=1 Tax=Lentithecium fluviatile CBS 122367 TaxID=1168545 RepID=A0A6G1IZK2_9PLEO|nr:hypothetical protein K458DRAFT_418980 [Lentithecium fluviatile CBS 122367]